MVVGAARHEVLVLNETEGVSHLANVVIKGTGPDEGDIRVNRTGRRVKSRETAEGENAQRHQQAHQSGEQRELAVGHRIVLLPTVLRRIVQVGEQLGNGLP